MTGRHGIEAKAAASERRRLHVDLRVHVGNAPIEPGACRPTVGQTDEFCDDAESQPACRAAVLVGQRNLNDPANLRDDQGNPR